MKPLFALPAIALLAACATSATDAVPAAQGSAVPLGQPVVAGAMVVTPREVVEDSRCPENARCVWAGRLIVRTAIASGEWQDVADLTLGKPYSAHGQTIALVSGIPEKQSDRETDPGEYRFVYEAGTLPAIATSENR